MNFFDPKALEKPNPDSKNADCLKTVVAIAASMGMNNLSVSKAFRIPSKDICRPRKIVAELISTQNKKILIKNILDK